MKREICREAAAVVMLLKLLPGAVASEALHPPLPAQAADAVWNWADDRTPITQRAEFAASREICRRFRDLEPPLSDWPDPETTATLAECDAEMLYYGIGMKADPVRARQCALLETRRPDGNGGPFNGTALLMTIYANGRGAPRDFDLAISLACRIDGAPAEVDGRVKHLQKLKNEQWSGRDFDYCDDITSGMAGGLCAVHQASLVEAQRSKQLDRVTASWSEAERRAFAPLQAAAREYAQISSENEVDLSGTARAAFIIEQEQHLKEAFRSLLKRLGEGNLPSASAARFRRADAELNEVYRQIMAIRTPPDERAPYSTADSLPWSTVTKQGIRTAQRAWLRYRDAWTAFAAVKYPGVAADSLKTFLTRQRTGELKQFLPEPSPRAAPKAVAISHRPLPETAATVLVNARSIVTGSAGNAPLFEVIFDPNAPSDAEFWRNIQRLHPGVAVRWLPVAYIGQDSAAIAATMLHAPDPAAALAANFRDYDTQARHGGLQPTEGGETDAAQATLREAWIAWGGYTPMLIFRDASGRLQRTGGANPEIIEFVLAQTVK